MSTSRTTSKTRKPSTAAGANVNNIKTVPINEIVPYWRNPRRITDDAVNALVTSIQRYGYQQPIVVDSENVIIIGHARYAALRRMEIEEVPVIVADLPSDKVKQLRVMDNRSQEFSSWNYEQLSGELDDLDKQLMHAYFPEVGALDDPGPQDPGAVVDPEPGRWDVPETEAEFVCPSCFHTWTMEVTVDAVKTGRLEVQA